MEEILASIRRMAVHPGPDLAAWTDLAGRLGFAGANVGERWSTPAGVPALAGTVERVQQDAKSREVTVALDRPGPGIALIVSRQLVRGLTMGAVK